MSMPIARAVVLAVGVAASATVPACVIGNNVYESRRGHWAEDRIVHVVLIELQDPAQAPQLQADCRRLLPECKGVDGFQCGPHVDTGRATVTGDYSVGIVVTFHGQEEYAAYLADPRHQQLVDTWKQRWKSARIYDFGPAGK